MAPQRPDFQHSVLHAELGELQRRDRRDPSRRACRPLRLPRERLVRSVLLAVAGTVALLLARPLVAMLWSDELVWWVTKMELSGQVAPAPAAEPLPWRIAVPLVRLFAGAPSAAALMYHAIGVVALWWAAGLLPGRARPLARLLRVAGVIHSTAVLFFWHWPASFAHASDAHIADGLQQCWVLMLLTPWLHLGTYYLLDVRWRHRVTLTLLTWAYLFLLAPLLYAAHALVLHGVGLLAMPLLYLMGGALVAVLGMVALHGWAASWGLATPAAGH